MVKIRYSELPAGLHVTAETQGRNTVVYLLPGLTTEQRRSALARVRSSGRMGQGPVLPLLAMITAVIFDRIRTTASNGAAAMRGHPVLLLPPLILLVSGVIVFMLMSFVTITVQSPGGAAGPDRPVPLTGAFARGHAPRPRPSLIKQGILPVAVGQPGSSASAAAPPASPRATPTLSTPSSPSWSPWPSPTPAPSSSPSASPSPSPSPSPSSSPTPSSSPSGACIKLGPLGLCVNI
jgi:hypothetical protein